MHAVLIYFWFHVLISVTKLHLLSMQLEEGASKIETPQQKLQRLQHEIRELGEEVNAIQENVKKDATAEKISPVDISKQLEYLQHQLNDLHLEKLLGPEAKVDLSDPQGQLKK